MREPLGFGPVEPGGGPGVVLGDGVWADAAAAYGRVLRGLAGLGWKSSLLKREP